MELLAGGALLRLLPERAAYLPEHHTLLVADAHIGKAQSFRRLGVPPTRCVLVEDTLVHQKAARSLGMSTVWMQRWIAAGPPLTAHKPARLHRRPAYVDRRIRRLQDLI